MRAFLGTVLVLWTVEVFYLLATADGDPHPVRNRIRVVWACVLGVLGFWAALLLQSAP